MQDIGLNFTYNKAEVESNNLAGKTFLATGSLENYSRKEIQELITSNGGKVISSVSKNLDYLIIGANPGSKLDKAQSLKSVTILSEEEFLGMINK